jgi:hypothetical protein
MHEYSIAARHDTSGELAALTEMVVDTADPGWGHQEHMIAVNETLGYTILGPPNTLCRLDVATVLG